MIRKSSAMRRLRVRLAALAVCAAMFPAASPAQSARATLTGNVYDSTGAAVVNAKVVVTATREGVSYNALTNSAGAYSVPELNPGLYSVRVEAGGFKTTEVSGLALEVGETARQNFTLQPGAVAATVEVSGSAVALDTDDSTVGQVIQNRSVVGLPLNGRNYLQLSLLTVGVAPANGSRSEATGSFSALGQHGSQTRVLLDGVDNSAFMSGGELGYQAQTATPSVDAVQEFKVVTDNSSAEYGLRMGGTVIVSTKSGTNDFHGTAYEFLRNNDLDARNYFSGGQAVPPYHRNEFGGVLGGPLRKDKTFFFVSYDGTRTSQDNPTISTVPLPAELQGDFTGQPTIYDPATTTSKGIRQPFPNNKIPSTRFDTVAQQIVRLFPAPNLPGAVNNFYFDSPTTDLPAEFDGRIDQTFNQRYRAFVRYSHRTDSQSSGGPLPLPADGAAWSTLSMTANSVVADLNTAISPTTYNDAAIGYSNLNSVLGIPATTNENAQYGLTGLANFGQYNQTGLAAFSLTGYASLGSKLSNPNLNNFSLVQLSDKVLMSRSNHAITAGVGAMGVQIKRLTAKNSRGSLTFDGAYTQNPQNRATTGSAIADLLLGTIDNLKLSNLTGETVTTINYSAFVQDNWHIALPLTLNLGVRWDLFTRPTYGHTPVDIFQFTPGTQNYQILYPHGTRDCGCSEAWKNFAPRLGFSYQVRPKTVIRSGFAIIFGEPDGIQDTAGGFFSQPPYYDAIAIKGNKTTQPAGLLAGGFPAENYNSMTVPANVNVDVADRYLPNQYTMQWFADLQQEIGQKSIFTLSYLGSGTRRLVIAVDQNQPTPGPGSLNSREPYPYFNSITLEAPVGDASYDALTAKLERRYANGLMILGAYTWSHAIDNAVENLNTVAGEGIQNNFDLAAERGNSVFDIRHYFVTSGAYDLPFGQGRRFLNHAGWVNQALGGWQLAGIVTLHSGPPFTPYLSTDIANTGTTNRPNRIGSGMLPPDQRTIQHWFNVADFAIPANYTFGDSGRNILTAPGTRNIDLKIGKDFPLVEKTQLQFRSEFFNAFNTPAFGPPDGEVDLPQGPTITSAGPAREIQLALKLVF
jgi:hypothetical protein